MCSNLWFLMLGFSCCKVIVMNKFWNCRMFTPGLIFPSWQHPWRMTFRSCRLAILWLHFLSRQHPVEKSSKLVVIVVGFVTGGTTSAVVGCSPFWCWFFQEVKIPDWTPSEFVGCSFLLLCVFWAYMLLAGQIDDILYVWFHFSIETHLL